MLALADIAVAERGAREHVDRAASGPMRLAAAGPFQDLGALVLGDHALELHQQCVFGAVAARALDEHHGRAGLGELLDQQRLIGVLASQPVGRVDQQHVHRDLADQIAQLFQRRPDQTRPGLAVVFEHPPFSHVQTQLFGVRTKRHGLGSDRVLFLLPGRGDPGIDRCVAHRRGSLPDRRARRARVVRGQGCGRPPTVPRPVGDRRRTRSRPPAGSPARMPSMRPRQKLLQRLCDHRRQRPPRRGGMRTDPRDERHRQFDGEHRGRGGHRNMSGPAGALHVAVRLPGRTAEPAGQLPRGLCCRHPRVQQVRGGVDPLGEHVTTSATGRPTNRHVTNILLDMSHRRTDTPRQSDTPIAQRHLKAEIANCVGGVMTRLWGTTRQPDLIRLGPLWSRTWL